MISAKTRSWDEADQKENVERDKRDPVQFECRKIKEREAAREAAPKAKKICGDNLDCL